MNVTFVAFATKNQGLRFRKDTGESTIGKGILQRRICWYFQMTCQVKTKNEQACRILLAGVLSQFLLNAGYKSLYIGILQECNLIGIEPASLVLRLLSLLNNVPSVQPAYGATMELNRSTLRRIK